MKLSNRLTKYSQVGTLLLTVFLLTTLPALAQSRDETNPTPITGFPVTGTLGSGTYYYQLPEALVSAGTASAVLNLTPPDGGASMTVTFSGRRCCPPDAYIGVTTGLSDPMREAARFNVPGQENLLVTVYISVGSKQTVRFSLNFNISSGSGPVIITPPTPSPTPAATTPTGAVCTDLGVDHFMVNGVGLTRAITGQVRNLTTTHPYKGYRRLQWVEVSDITDSEKGPPVVGRVLIPAIIDPGATFSYRVLHTMTVSRRTRYKIQIRYSPYNATDRSPYNDDCNSANNSTRRQLIGGFDVEEVPVARP